MVMSYMEPDEVAQIVARIAELPIGSGIDTEELDVAQRSTVLREVDMVKVHRLVSVYDAWAAIGLAYRIPRHKVYAAPPQMEHLTYSQRDFRYHIGRIRYFVDRIRAGNSIDPIEVITTPCRRQTELEVADGHHRLIAARALHVKTIACIYQGDRTAWDWLRGVPGVSKPIWLSTNALGPRH